MHIGNDDDFFIFEKFTKALLDLSIFIDGKDSFID